MIKMMANNMISKILGVLYAALLPLNDLNPITVYKVPTIRNTIPNNKNANARIFVIDLRVWMIQLL